MLTIIKQPHKFLLGLFMVLCAYLPSAATAQHLYTGEIMMTAATYCPQGTLVANGAVLQVSTYPTLAQLLGSKYGGDGVTTFGLPDLQNTLGPITKMRFCIESQGIFPPRGS